MRRRTLISGLLLAGLLAAASMRVPGQAQAPQQPRQVLDLGADPDDVVIGQPEYSPYLYQAYPRQVYWGDTHLHTSYSTDAGMLGNRLGPEDAYRFAIGEVVVSSLGLRARLQRPLDFLVIADHAENLGLAPMIAESNPDLLRTAFGREIHRLVRDGRLFDAYGFWGDGMMSGDDPLPDEVLIRSMWERLTTAGEQYNRPGRFTALLGYEWSSSPEGNNLHRVVIFRDAKDKVDTILPFSNYDSADPEDLWAWMANYEERTGGQVLAIAHNGNLSNGLMFDDVTLGGDALDRDYAERRARWEPLYEVTQIKGDGEAHPFLSPNDEFADYGTWDKGSFGPQPKTQDMLPREYAREALKRGLRYEAALGANPFKFGLVGSTDSHTSLATSEEDNFFGKVTLVEPSADPERFDEVVTGLLQEPGGPDITIRHYQSLASGLAAIWATENTRTALFDAMARKEVYATTGTRMTVRVFGGWEFEEDDVLRPDFAQTGYANGVPMGGDLVDAPSGTAPTFMVRALRDVDGANLDRIQIVKGWLDAGGGLEERVYDLVCSDNRALTAAGRCERDVGTTVDVPAATYTNSIGEALLMGFWQDPDFDPAERAVYYIRVLEIPTPRWTTYDAAFFGVDLPDGVPATHQERAYTSPIWYTPGN